MEYIHYAGSTVFTGTAIAEALIEYARALSQRNESDTVRIPSRLEDGSTGSAEFLLGPSSQLVSETEPESDVDNDEIVDEELVEYFRSKTALLTQPRATHIDQDESHSSVMDDLEFPAEKSP